MAIKFGDEQHEKRFYAILGKMKSGDVYHTSVAYLLTLDIECYRHIDSLFDFEEDVIKPYGALNQAWQTGTSAKTTRLMFNLWRGSYEDYDRDEKSVKDSSRKYTVDEIFSSNLALWYFEAIKLRYPNIGEVE